VTTAGLHLPVSRLIRRVTSSSGRGQLSLPSRPGLSTAVGTQVRRRRRTTTDVYIDVNAAADTPVARLPAGRRRTSAAHRVTSLPVGANSALRPVRVANRAGNNPAVAHQRCRRYARRSAPNRSLTSIRRTPVDPVSPSQLSLSTSLGPRLRLPLCITAAYQPCRLKVRPSVDCRRQTSVHHQE